MDKDKAIKQLKKMDCPMDELGFATSPEGYVFTINLRHFLHASTDGNYDQLVDEVKKGLTACNIPNCSICSRKRN